ncbi:MAG: MFS transporter [Acidobacteria bacterium]|nr:MFS transporter [Acidobacteriota bacterium]
MNTREQRGWYFYDWANSAFYTTVVTLFFGPYLTGLAQAGADARGFVYPLGVPVDARAWWPYVLSLSVAAQIVVLPVVGVLADSSGRRKALLALFSFAGAAATLGMGLLTGSRYLAGGALFVFANLGYGAAMVVYNSFLPLIARPEERDRVSARGWGLGYLGGGIMLALAVALFQRAGALGLSESQAVRISLSAAGAWWALFTLIPLAALRDRPALRAPAGPVLRAAFSQLARTVAELRRYRQAFLFLLAYLVYNDPIQAVIALASQFGAGELKLSMASLTMAILMVQFVAFPGALLFDRLARVVGSKRALAASLGVWIAVLAAMYSLVRGERGFFLAAFAIALVLGGSQALSRSLFSQMIPRGKEGEFFSLYEVSDKGTSWLAPALFGLVVQWTGSYRASILAMMALFVAGLALLGRVDVARGARDAALRDAS